MTIENIDSADETPSFGLGDLVFTLHVYEICTQRGAFKADELSSVGAVYDRLHSFLLANNAIEPHNPEQIETEMQE